MTMNAGDSILTNDIQRIDPKIVADGIVTEETWAVVYAPRRTRKRFPESCVTPMPSRRDAEAAAAGDPQRHAARVIGPSRSSEGQRLYYLVQWME